MNRNWLGLLLLCWHSLLWAAEPTKPQRIALVIGNDQYQSVPRLSNAVADARAMAVNLEKLGYQVLLAVNSDRELMLKAVFTFTERLHKDDEAVFFYAGHGVQLQNENYLLPTDIRANNEKLLRSYAIPLQDVLDHMSRREVRFSLSIIDACRDNPFSINGRNLGQGGLGQPLPATGQMVIYSAGTGQQALDKLGAQDQNPNGLFTRVFLQEMMRPNLTIGDVLHNVRDKVYQQSRSVGREQVPALFDQAPGRFYFNPQAGLSTPGGMSDLQMTQDNQAQWQEEMRTTFQRNLNMHGSLSEQLAAWQQFLTVFAPNNPYSEEDEALRAQASAKRDAVEKQLLTTLMPEQPATTAPDQATAPEEWATDEDL